MGKDGVEKTYEAELRGTPGTEQIEVDRQGRPIRVVASKPPVQGLDVRLSIDVNVQQAAETALAEGLAATRGHLFKDDRKPLVADAGSVVALDVKEGSVLALASYPTFDLPGLAGTGSGATRRRPSCSRRTRARQPRSSTGPSPASTCPARPGSS